METTLDNLVDWIEHQREAEAEWEEDIPIETYSTTGVLCTVCSAVNPMRNHLPKGKFSLQCPKCRRRENNRKVQAKRYARMKAATRDEITLHARIEARVLRMINTGINRIQAKNKARIKAIRERLETQATPSQRSQRALSAREESFERYERIRKIMLRDFAANQLKPLE